MVRTSTTGCRQAATAGRRRALVGAGQGALSGGTVVGVGTAGPAGNVGSGVGMGRGVGKGAAVACSMGATTAVGVAAGSMVGGGSRRPAVAVGGSVGMGSGVGGGAWVAVLSTSGTNVAAGAGGAVGSSTPMAGAGVGAGGGAASTVGPVVGSGEAPPSGWSAAGVGWDGAAASAPGVPTAVAVAVGGSPPPPPPPAVVPPPAPGTIGSGVAITVGARRSGAVSAAATAPRRKPVASAATSNPSQPRRGRVRRASSVSEAMASAVFRGGRPPADQARDAEGHHGSAFLVADGVLCNDDPTVGLPRGPRLGNRDVNAQRVARIDGGVQPQLVQAEEGQAGGAEPVLRHHQPFRNQQRQQPGGHTAAEHALGLVVLAVHEQLFVEARESH